MRGFLFRSQARAFVRAPTGALRFFVADLREAPFGPSDSMGSGRVHTTDVSANPRSGWLAWRRRRTGAWVGLPVTAVSAASGKEDPFTEALTGDGVERTLRVRLEPLLAGEARRELLGLADFCLMQARAQSRSMKTSRARLVPSDGPTMPRSSISSTMRAARL